MDVIASLEAIMKQNTAFYQSDFEIDKRILREAASRPAAEEKRLLWFSRPSGTCCFWERDVFLKDTRQHNTWRFYGEQTRDKILAYAVELTGKENGIIKGNLYELDYPQHFREVVEKSLPADNYTLLYEHGERVQPAGMYFDGNPDPQLGKFERFEAQPNDPEALHFLMREEKHSYDRLKPGDFKAHITALHDSRIEAEAQRMYDEKARVFGLLPTAPVMPGVTELMRKIRQKGLQIGIVTGSAQHTLIKRMAHDFKEFVNENCIVTAYDVQQGKPAPEPYLMGLQKAGNLQPWQGIVVENAPMGVRAGVSANIFTIAVNSGPLPDASLTAEGVNLLFKKMTDLKEAWDLLAANFDLS